MKAAVQMKSIITLLLALVLSFCSCIALAESATAQLRDRYAQAELQMANQNYAGAAELFEALGAYSDASQMAMYCKALMAAEDMGLYEIAVQAFEGLGEFKDSKQMATYYHARGLEAAGDSVNKEKDADSTLKRAITTYQLAETSYSSLSLFRDSLSRYSDCIKKENALSEELKQRDLARKEEKYQKLKTY